MAENVMTRIFDSIELKFTQRLQDVIRHPDVKRVVFSVRYSTLHSLDINHNVVISD